jgi:hypothetical protein
MVATKRRGHGEDSIYFDQANSCWVGSVSLGYSTDGKRRRRTVRGRTKTEVRDKLRGLREDIAASVQAPAAYTFQRAVDDWLASGLDGRSAGTVTKYRLVLEPLLKRIGRANLRDLTANDVWMALTALAEDRSSSTVAIAHNALTRAIRHAEARDLVRRNVSALIDTPKGQGGQPSKALTLEQARALLEAAGDLRRHRLGAYVALRLQTGIRTEEARALTWEHVDWTATRTVLRPCPPASQYGIQCDGTVTLRRGLREGRWHYRSRQPRPSARTASSRTKIVRGLEMPGSTKAWCSARGSAGHWMLEISGVNSAPSQLPPASARSGHRRSSGTPSSRCCPPVALRRKR